MMPLKPTLHKDDNVPDWRQHATYMLPRWVNQPISEYDWVCLGLDHRLEFGGLGLEMLVLFTH